MIATPAFLARDMPAVLVDARQVIVTDAQHSRAVPQVEEINNRLQDCVRPLIEQGACRSWAASSARPAKAVTTTIGRGGSDFSAALVGAGLNAERIEIWTDVDGMKTTDPRICADARRIKVISFEEAAELAYFGAKVLHPATVLAGGREEHSGAGAEFAQSLQRRHAHLSRAPRSHSLFKAIAAKSRITIIDIVAARMLMAHGFLAKVFEVFARHRCAVDVVSTSEVSISLTVDSNEAIPQIAADLEELAFVKYSGRQAIVCLVGENIRETPGVAAQIFDSIRDINVRMISQGASEINLTFVIDEDHVPEAVRRLHARFFADVDPEVFD